MEITATINGKVKIISEASIRRYLKLEDSDGISDLPTIEIFEQLALMGYVSNSDKLTFQKGHFFPQWKFLIHTILHCLSSKKTAWEQFSSNIATAIICLATNRTFNFSKLSFDGMVKNLESVDDRHGGAATTVSGLEAGQGSGRGFFQSGRKIAEIEEDLDISLAQQMIHHDSQTQGRQEYDLEPNFEFTAPEERRNRRRSKQIVEPELRTIVETPVATMADTRTMSELLQAPTEGYGDAIVIPAILAENFELKVGLLTLVTSSQFHGFERDDPHSHIRWFNKITSTLKYKNVPHDAIKLMLFPFSLEGAARIWLEKEPPRSIHTWEDLVSKFVNYFFPPSKTTNLKNDIMNFQQRFDETFSEAWDHFKDILSAVGNLLNRTPRDALTIIENKLKVCTSRNKPVVSKVTTSSSTPAYLPKITALTDAVKAMLLQNKTPSPAPVKAIEEICVTYGGPHPYYECLATEGNTFNASAATETYNQGGLGYRPQGETNYCASNQIRPPGFP
ncbi:reverse transcriptase domain-containing protein [Tanacetum coccineum]